MTLDWHVKTFSDLDTNGLYSILKIRQAIFIVEQKSIYNDIDEQDQQALHIYKKDPNTDEIMAYARILPPQKISSEVSFGRVLVNKNHRGHGLGKQLIKKTLSIIDKHHPEADIKISAQEHLKKLYEEFGFVETSKPYLEDGIPHIDMVKKH